jgi:hypothetical protein
LEEYFTKDSGFRCADSVIGTRLCALIQFKIQNSKFKIELRSTPVTTRETSSKLGFRSLLQEFFGRASGAGGT